MKKKRSRPDLYPARRWNNSFAQALWHSLAGDNQKGGSLKVLFRFTLILFFLSAPLVRANPVAAQAGGSLVISAPDTQEFPTVHLQFDAYGPQGNVLEVKPEDVQIAEDGTLLKPTTLVKAQNALQVIITLNTSPTMANQVSGISGYQQIQSALTSWASAQPASTKDDFSLSTQTGLFLIREHDPQKLVKAINDYKPDLLHTQPALGSLAESLDMATDPLNNPLTKRAILYITAPLPATANTTITDLTNRAKGIGVRVNVWEIVQGNQTGADAQDSLHKLADTTGGQFQAIPPNSPLPDIEPVFQPLRQTYQVTYTSNIQKGGVHRLSVQVNQGRGTLASNEQKFDLSVQPPNPIFLSPPSTITRSSGAAASSGASTANVSGAAGTALSPDKVSLQIMVEFPDQHKRALKASRLYVDDKLVEENTSEPFDRFTWSIADLTTSGQKMLRVEVIDVLGISGSSIEMPVEVVVNQPAKASVTGRVSRRGMVAIGAITFAGAVLGLVLVVTSRRRQLRKNLDPASAKRKKDPLTQPVPIQQDTSKPRKEKSTPARSASWPVHWPKPAAQNAPARLITLDDNEQPITGGMIALARQEITFGSDPKRATQLLDSPTVDGLHARLYRSEDGQFYLSDQGSVAGTWINYAPLSANGTRLEHGDLIHIGKIMFRFELTESSHIPTPEVQSIDLKQ